MTAFSWWPIDDRGFFSSRCIVLNFARTSRDLYCETRLNVQDRFLHTFLSLSPERIKWTLTRSHRTRQNHIGLCDVLSSFGTCVLACTSCVLATVGVPVSRLSDKLCSSENTARYTPPKYTLQPRAEECCHYSLPLCGSTAIEPEKPLANSALRVWQSVLELHILGFPATVAFVRGSLMLSLMCWSALRLIGSLDGA